MILGGTYGAGGVTAPGSEYRYATVDAGSSGTVLEQIRTDGGSIRRVQRIGSGWTLPAVTWLGDAGGLSANGRRLVLVRTDYDRRGLPTSPTEMLLVDTHSLKPRRHLELDGIFSFDAISPDGRSLYLVQYASARRPLDYRVRRYDVGAGEFRGGAIVDPDEPDEKMTGQPLSRAYSPDGAWAYTLYGGGDETFVHALDTASGTAQCIDLEGIGEGNSYYRLTLDADPATGALTVRNARQPLALVDPRTFEVSQPPEAGRAGASADDDTAGAGAEWVAPLAIGGGVLLLAAAAFLAVRRRPGAAGLIAVLAAALAAAFGAGGGDRRPSPRRASRRSRGSRPPSRPTERSCAPRG